MKRALLLLLVLATTVRAEELRIVNPTPSDAQTTLPAPLAGVFITVINASATQPIAVRGTGIAQVLDPSTTGRFASDGNVWRYVDQYPPPGGGAAFYQTIDDEDTPLTQRATLNFTGAGVACADDAGVQTTCTIAGGGGSTPTGTGYRHVTAGVEDAAADLVTLTSATDVAPNQGTTTTVLHGNAAGQASFTSIVAADIASGVLAWTDDGGNVRPTTIGDTVSISTATPATGMELTVAGEIGPDTTGGARGFGAAANRWGQGFFSSGLTVGPDSTGTGASFYSAANSQIDHFVGESASGTASVASQKRNLRARGTLGGRTTVATFDIVKRELSEADAGAGYLPIVQEYTYVASRSATNNVSGTWGVATRPPGAGAIPIARLEIDHNGNFIWGDQTNNLATTATNGFVYLGAGAGQPTGTPGYVPPGANPAFYDNTNHAQFVYSGGWHQIGEGLIRVASDFATTSTTFANVTGLTYPIKASSVYSIECNFSHITAINTTALQLSINGPASPTAMRFCISTGTTATASHHACQNAYDAITNPATGANSVSLPVTLRGIVENGANAGTLAVRARSEVSGSSVTVQRGSFCKIQQQ